ncbi:LysR family transcriptional regulator [Parathalassolituus penaei]|uniref:LysR family transcriptional regulator n=1 Tax=Parathalassolituus penaei TaxID=2997323 RepID=A0A9X3EFC3_9GAMM|nr:LysR family transcriptional regulator [Parathalassolituus penaei]MCY0966236.1 LysR family transcriptional regulator [Parathalassolituus penaei]
MALNDLNLRFFHSVATTGSLSAAAEDLHVAVSAVSRQISNLEDSLGIRLFERKPRGMALTGPGEILLAYAERNRLEISNVVAEMRGLNTLQQYNIRIACTEGMAWHCLPSIMAAFRREQPGARFALQVVDATQASLLVKEGKADLALTFSLSPLVGVEVAYSLDAPICALMPAHHPLATQAQLSVRDLQGYPLALSSPDTTLHYLFDTACHLHGLTLLPTFSSDSLGTIYTVTRCSDDVVALCAEITVRGRAAPDGLVLVPMSDRPLQQRSLQVQVMAGRKLPAMLQCFLDSLIGALSAAA